MTAVNGEAKTILHLACNVFEMLRGIGKSDSGRYAQALQMNIAHY